METERTAITTGSLQPEHTYKFSVRAKTGENNWGPWSRNVTFTTCPENMRRTLKGGGDYFALIGYYRFGNEARSCGALSESITENSCLENNVTVGTLPIELGYWRDSLKTDYILRCPRVAFCNNSSLNVSGPRKLCALNHAGVYCYDCVENYVLSSTGCKECTDDETRSHQSRLILFVVVMVILFFLGIFKITCGAGVFRDTTLLNILRCERTKSRNRMKCVEWAKKTIVKSWNSLRDGFVFIEIKVRILMGFFQVFSFQRTFQKGTSDTNTSLLEMITGLNPSRLADEFNVRCAYNYNHYDTLYMYTLVPIVFVILVLGVFMVLSRLYNQYKENLRQEVITTVFYLTFLVYPGVSQTILETFLCEDFPTADGVEIFKSALRADYRLSCENTKERIVALAYSSIMLVEYPIGIVLLYVSFLKRYHDLILKQEFSDLREEERNMLKRVSFLIKPYKTQKYWFETYELLRKLIQTSLVAILQDTLFPNLSPAIAMNISIIVMVLLVFMKPYKNQGDFWFAFFSLVLLIPASQLSILELSPKQITNGNYGIMGVEFGLMFVIVLVEIWWKKKMKSEVEVKKIVRNESHTEEEFVGVVNENLCTLNENRKLREKVEFLKTKIEKLESSVPGIEEENGDSCKVAVV